MLGNGQIDKKIADSALLSLEIDELGLDNIDRIMLEAIIKSYNGGPVGLETLAALIGEEAVTICLLYTSCALFRRNGYCACRRKRRPCPCLLYTSRCV